MGRLDGKVAVITGAAGGMGARGPPCSSRRRARRCASPTWTATGGERTAAEVRDAFFVEVDVSDEASVQAMYAATVERYGGIDVLYSNAGISPADNAGVLETSLEASPGSASRPSTRAACSCAASTASRICSNAVGDR